ncbi:bifunctional 4-hydroxy-2-oxoglutarate aldolase/2-dehydro-3-deoxy-phosphogluconate aldolase [Clostridium sp. MT-14]|uniref:bifunctional 4-hydroxy-2-oxoglutarate aldolase/2-dehydro-3-deoxy-phosphogluconate aldolase n=1 Tax=Clostridium sp. MT-14 TaxID=3348360 RepID=UPI0035F42963
MSKYNVAEKINKKIIAVVRCKDFTLAEKISEKLIVNGIKAIEVTYTVKNAGNLIQKLKKRFPDILVGAGTIVNLTDAKEAIENEADFIVSPCTVEEVCKICKEKDIFCFLGALTPTEVFRAYKMGADVIKLFPGSSLKPSYIKELKAPFPYIDFMPTGGANKSNIREWFENGAVAVGLGGYFTNNINENNLNEIDKRVRDIFDALN